LKQELSKIDFKNPDKILKSELNQALKNRRYKIVVMQDQQSFQYALVCSDRTMDKLFSTFLNCANYK
jgi:hypothetical protein